MSDEILENIDLVSEGKKPIIKEKEAVSLILIGLLSLLISLYIVVLLIYPRFGQLVSLDFSVLNEVRVVLNSICIVLLTSGYWNLFSKNWKWHRLSMRFSGILFAFVVISYFTYPYQWSITHYGDLNLDGIVDAAEKTKMGHQRVIYFLILLTHLMSIVLFIPFGLMTLYLTVTRQMRRYFKIIKWVTPLWLYLVISAIVVYWMIRPYYL